LRTGDIRQIIRQDRRKIDFVDFMEDFMEELNEIKLLDPETENQADYLARIELDLPDELYIKGVPRYVRYALQELLRNAIMYSLRGTPIRIRVVTRQTTAQIDVIDEGYGVRESEWRRVFAPFERARQPQVISEFGYGLCLHLCKQEIEAMNGQLWFTTEENVGTTFSMNLPLWATASSSSSDNEP
jgi:signal transduction histidine kinase